MMDYKIQRWPATDSDSTIFQIGTAFFEGRTSIRVSRYTYEHGQIVHGRGKACHIFVAEGGINLDTSGVTVLLRAGQFIAFSGGPYKVHAGSNGAIVFWAWDTDALRRKKG